MNESDTAKVSQQVVELARLRMRIKGFEIDEIDEILTVVRADEREKWEQRRLGMVKSHNETLKAKIHWREKSEELAKQLYTERAAWEAERKQLHDALEIASDGEE